MALIEASHTLTVRQPKQMQGAAFLIFDALRVRPQR